MRLQISRKRFSFKENYDFIFSFVFVTICFLGLFFFFLQNKELYLKKFDIDYWDRRYSVSQWATPHPEELISDPELYAIAGSKYIRGEDPNNTLTGHPPLGHYLIGFSILLFGNEKIMNFIIGILSLLVFFYLAKLIFKRSSVAWLLVLLFSFEPVFRYQLKISLLDVFQLFFALLAVIFLFKAKENYRYYFLTAVALGCIMATKTPVSGMILYGAFLIFSLLERDYKGFCFLIGTAPLILITYTLTYSVHFIHNLSPGYFFRFHREQAEWRLGQRVPWGGAWRILLSGWWQTWWEGPKFIRVSEWTIIWPILTLFSLLSPLVFWLDKKKNKILIIILWVFSYLCFLHFIATFPRYLLFIFPGFYLLGFYVLQEISRKLAKLRYNLRK